MLLDIVILAAGQGTRMNSRKPKVLHEIAGKPMLQHVIDAGRQLDDANIHIVVGHGADQVKTALADQQLNFVVQTEQLGTGHAVLQALPALTGDSCVLILYGDVPLVNPATLKQLVMSVKADTMALLTVDLPEPSGYGRIVRDHHNRIVAIVEEKDTTEAQRQIREVNTGIMAVPQAKLAAWLPSLGNSNAQGEYYLTDVIALAHRDGLTIASLQAPSATEVLGVNDRKQQAAVERLYQHQQARDLMARGVTLMDPERFDCRGTVSAGRDVVIDVNVVLEGSVVLGDDVVIEPNCVIKNTQIGAGSRIKANTVIEDAAIGDAVDIGPFARIRPGTVLADGVRIGNFVETKNARLGVNSKANHLAYIGDANIGQDCNIGAGTITCNYDGANKFKTELGSRVFIGSNSTLVAPLKIEDDGFVGAGSTITKTVASQQLAIGRGKQRNIDGWQRPTKKPQQ